MALSSFHSQDTQIVEDAWKDVLTRGRAARTQANTNICKYSHLVLNTCLSSNKNDRDSKLMQKRVWIISLINLPHLPMRQ